MAHITTLTRAYNDLYNSQANTYSYSGSFETFKESEVKVKLDGTLLTYNSSPSDNTQYSVNLTDKTIHVGGGNLSSGTLSIYPQTDLGAPTLKAPYTAGSAITATDLTNNQKQIMRKAMEFDENKLSSQGGTMTGHLTMGEDTTIIFEGATDDGYETTLTVTDPTADRTITLPNVTGTVVTTGDTGSVDATMLAANSVDSSELVDGSIDTSHIGNLQVTTDKIAADAVTGAKIADDAINSEHYTDGSIDTAHIADSQVTTAKIADTAVTTAKITDGNITTAKIAADAITAAKIADDVVNSEHYAAGSIDTEHIADSQITTAKIADSNVTTAKIAADAITGAKIADDSINSEHYVDGSIATAHIGASQVETANIANLNVTTGKLADSAVATAKIAADAVTGAKIADDAVDSEHLAADSIDTEHYAAASVDTTALASNAVTEAKITDANVTTDKIANDAVTIGKIGCEQTTISNSDSHIPTSGAVVDYVAAQIAPIGGLEVIADEDNFPTSQPGSGVVISISDAAGIVVNGSGVSTTARTAGNGSDNVTINNFPSSLYNETLASGVGLMVSSTGSSHTYNYHKLLAAETDVKQLSDDINDFNARYRVSAGEPGSNNDDGDLVFDTNANKMKVYDATAGAWTEVTSTGDFKFLVPVDAGTTTAATFDGSDTSFDLKETTNSGSAASVTNINQLIVSLNGVIQKPNTGSYSASEEGFYLTDTDTIRFCTAPATGSSCFIIQCGSAVSIPTPGDGTVTAAKIASGAVTTAKIADANVTTAKIADDAVTGGKIAHGTVAAINLQTDAVETSKILNGAVTQAKLADQAVNEAKLQVSNAPTNGYFLSAQSGNTGGLTWAQVTTDLVGDTSPQLGGDLQSNGNDIDFADDDKAIFGTGGDLEIYHASGDNNSYIHEAGSGHLVLKADDLYIQNASGSQTNIKSTSGGAVELSHAGSKRLETTNTGTHITGTLSVDEIDMTDNEKILLGTGDDLEIYHDGSHSYIRDNGDGNLVLKGSEVVIQSGNSSETKAIFKNDGACELYHNDTLVFTTSQYGGNFAKAGEAIVEIGSTDGNGAYLTLDGASNGDGSGGDHATIMHDTSGNLHIKTDSPASNVSIAFSTNGTQRTIIDESGHLKPNADNTYDLGTSTKRWRNIYTNDLHLSNEGSSNDVDGTWGDWTIQEGESDLFLKNNRSGKKYKFNLTEVS